MIWLCIGLAIGFTLGTVVGIVLMSIMASASIDSREREILKEINNDL